MNSILLGMRLTTPLRKNYLVFKLQCHLGFMVACSRRSLRLDEKEISMNELRSMKDTCNLFSIISHV